MHPVLCILGTRPEAIKVLPVVRALRCASIPTRVLFTAQHTHLAEEVFDLFGILPDLRLPARGEGTLTDTLTAMLSPIGHALAALTPCAVVVQGDTLSAFAGGLCAFFRHIPLYHMEAGLRTGVYDEPYPEEMLRRALTAMASVHFATTEQARAHLLREGVAPSSVACVGNTVLDALHAILPSCHTHPSDGRYRLLLTLHRRETDTSLRRRLLVSIRRLLDAHPAFDLFFPMHPTAKEVAQDVLGHTARAHLCKPMGPRAFYEQLLCADLVLTDSGGVQEEAAYLGVRTLVLRDVTEREAELSRGELTLTGRSPARVFTIANACMRAIEQAPPVDAEARRLSALTGTHGAAHAIAERIAQDVKEKERMDTP